MAQTQQSVAVNGEVTLRKSRLAFPDLFQPSAMNDNQPKQFGATFLVAKGSETEKAVQAKIMEVAKAKWGKDAVEVLEDIKNNPQKFCFINGDGIDKRKLDGYPGHMALSAKNKRRPTVLDREGAPTTEADGVVYAGCNVNAKVEIWAQDNEHGRAMRASLLGVVFHSKNDAFGGGRVASEAEMADLVPGDDEDDDAGEGKGMV